jgi:hypothetical protein
VKPATQIVKAGTGGAWQVLVRAEGRWVDVTLFRGAPTAVSGVGTTDPFGPSVATLTFPTISILDELGAGDLWWYADEAPVDLVWADGSVRPWRWQGTLGPIEYATDDTGVGVSLSCVGAMRAQDGIKAKPRYWGQPVPYEVAMARTFDEGIPGTRLGPLNVVFPDWWTRRFRSKDYPANQPWLVPDGVSDGELWSGMLTRQSGNWEDSLTGYMQGLLSSMHTERGQFTLMLGSKRDPQLIHRTHLSAPAEDTLVLDVASPTVKVSGSREVDQRIDVAYAQGTAADGDTYTGMEVSADGESTFYLPAGFNRRAWPVTDDNMWLDRGRPRREAVITFNDGLTAQEALEATRLHQRRFAEAGFSGSVTVTSDPVTYGTGDRVAHQTVEAGRSVLLVGLFGRRDGVLAHITETTTDGEASTWTVDTLFRDHLTVDQVARRGRDALVPYRMLSTSGTYSPKVPDLLFPWSYSKGAGMVPWRSRNLWLVHGPGAVKKNTSVTDPFAVPFPWTTYTRAFPPKSNRAFYIRIGPKQDNANRNWANASDKKWPSFRAFPVRLSARGEIRMAQFAAYDKNGNVKKVPFHVSLYVESGVSYTSMPMIPADSWKLVAKAATVTITSGSKNVVVSVLPKNHTVLVGERITVAGKSQAAGEHIVTARTATTVTFQLGANATSSAVVKAKVSEAYTKTSPYPVGQHYPFFPKAWEKVNPDGTDPTNTQQMVAQATMIAGWGTYYEKAGFWPGSSADPDADPTGLLVDETPFSYDFTSLSTGVNRQKPASWNTRYADKVNAYVMIYCDADPNEETFFLGRLWRKEPSA